MKYYFANPERIEEIYGDQMPVCIPETDLQNLASGWSISVDDLMDQLHEASAAEIAQQIRDSAEWDSDLLAALCELAGMEAEWAAADGESFERVAEAAADKLGVSIY